jgi:hypothetical protein
MPRELEHNSFLSEGLFPSKLYTTTAPQYEYRKLEDESQIRLLHFDSVSGYSVVQTSLKTPPRYETVSYAWGMPSKEWCITIDGAALAITESLAVALRRLVTLSQTKYLWIDQICINQADPMERGHQVVMMGKIYAKGERVMVWLDCVFGSMRDEDYFRSFLQDCDRASTRVIYEQTIHSRLKRPEMRDTLQFLLHQPWFRRAWIVQEAVLSEEVVMILDCFEISFQRLCDLVEELRRQRVQAPGIQFLETMIKKKEELGQNIFAEDFYWFLRRMVGCETSEIRDHVYAFIGMSSDPRISIVPDYTQSVASVFTSTTRTIIQSTHSLDIFGILNPKAPNELNLPSWVPDWSQDIQHAVPLYKGHDRNLFNASAGRTHATVDPNPQSLAVNGWIIDQIAHVVVKDSPKRASVTQNTLPIEESLSEIQCTDLGGSKSITRHRVLRTYLAEGANAGHRMYVNCQGSGAFTMSSAPWVISHNTAPLKGMSEILVTGLLQKHDHPDHSVQISEDLDHLSTIRQQRSLVYCWKGRLGLAPEGTEIGDKVAILHGSRVPIVLREQAGGKYTVLGQCYYEGAMFGESVGWHEHQAQKMILV